MKKFAALSAAGASVVIAGLAAQPAGAAIKCQGPNQVTRHGLIGTPWCEDNYLAQIAGYSPRAIRNNPSIKQEACELVGHDPRVSEICAGFRFNGSRTPG